MKPSFSSLKGLITNEAARDHYHLHVSLSTRDLLVLLMTLILTEMKMNTLYRYEYSWFYLDLSQNTVMVKMACIRIAKSCSDDSVIK